MNSLEGVETMFTSDLQFSFISLALRLFVPLSNVHMITIIHPLPPPPPPPEYLQHVTPD
jgi:hypothetical protein